MISHKNLFNNNNMKEIASLGSVKVFEHEKDLSLKTPEQAIAAYYASEMNIRKRQVLIELNNNAFTISAGAMQWMAGDVNMVADVKGIGDLFGKAISSKVTKESAIKPKYQGTGLLMLEPTYKHILLEDISTWGGLVLEDGLFWPANLKLLRKSLQEVTYPQRYLVMKAYLIYV